MAALLLGLDAYAYDAPQPANYASSSTLSPPDKRIEAVREYCLRRPRCCRRLFQGSPSVKSPPLGVWVTRPGHVNIKVRTIWVHGENVCANIGGSYSSGVWWRKMDRRSVALTLDWGKWEVGYGWCHGDRLVEEWSTLIGVGWDFFFPWSVVLPLKMRNGNCEGWPKENLAGMQGKVKLEKLN